MEAQIKVGRILGIPIGLHYTWIFIVLSITLPLAQGLRTMNPDWAPGVPWATAILTGVLFFVTLVAHELSHALVARAHGLPVRSITLFALGGVTHIERQADDPRSEFWLGIAGPITSGLLGVACLGLARGLGWTTAAEPQTPGLAMLAWLGYLNTGIALFNMIPAFPMDGGRVLRALVWRISRSRATATRIAALAGQGIAVGLIAFGMFGAFSGGGFAALWLVLVGGFLFMVALASYQQAVPRRHPPLGAPIGRDIHHAQG